MNNKVKIGVIFFLAIIMAFSPSLSVLAQECYSFIDENHVDSWLLEEEMEIACERGLISPAEFDAIARISNDIRNMTEQELNALINQSILGAGCGEIESISIGECYSEAVSKSPVISDEPELLIQLVNIKIAWLAAAQIARKKGYPCAAKLVEHSVIGLDYYEYTKSFGRNLFKDKILRTNEYRNLVNYHKGFRNLGTESVIEFTKAEDKDLYYALHSCTGTMKTIGRGVIGYQFKDRFDFALEKDYSDLFSDFVNNWALLCQYTIVLWPIWVTIEFEY